MKTVLVLTAIVAVAVCFMVPQQILASSTSCQMCELAVKTYVESADKDVTSIKTKFEAECKKLFKDVPFGPQECKKFVDNELDPIIKELEGGTAPKDVCTKLGKCKKT